MSHDRGFGHAAECTWLVRPVFTGAKAKRLASAGRVLGRWRPECARWGASSGFPGRGGSRDVCFVPGAHGGCWWEARSKFWLPVGHAGSQATPRRPPAAVSKPKRRDRPPGGSSRAPSPFQHHSSVSGTRLKSGPSAAPSASALRTRPPPEGALTADARPARARWHQVALTRHRELGGVQASGETRGLWVQGLVLPPCRRPSGFPRDGPRGGVRVRTE